MKLALSSPWVEYYHKLCTFFRHDADVHLSIDYDTLEITLRVDNQLKADALTKLLPTEKTWGAVTIQIKVIPANEEENKAVLLQNALLGNEAVSDIDTYETMFGTYTCVLFKPIVAQYYNDNMRDPNGITTTLYQELAKEIFGEESDIVYCTEDDR